MEDFEILAIPSPLSLLFYIYIYYLLRVPNLRLNRLNDLFLRFDRPVRRSAWLYSYMFRLAGHYGSSGMAGQKKRGGGSNYEAS